MSDATDRAKNCRAHAEQCRAWFELATHALSKEEFIKVALQWENLAQEIEQIERMRTFVTRAART